MSWSKEQVLSFLGEEVRLGRLATATPDGEPHVVPIWFKVQDGRILVHTQAESRKARDIAANGRFSITVDKADPPYRGVSISGPAEVVPDDAEGRSVALVRELALTYLGTEVGAGFGDHIAAMPGVHVTLVLTPERWEAWDFSQG